MSTHEEYMAGLPVDRRDKVTSRTKELLVEEARAMFHEEYGQFKGVIGVCSYANWIPGTSDGRPILKVYVDNVWVVETLPLEYQGVEVQYYITSDGIHPGCD